MGECSMEKIVSIEDPKAVDLAVKCLNSGGVITLPTDTVYGLACNATDKTAIQKLYKIKGRCEEKPLAICVGNIDDIDKWAKIDHIPLKLLRKLLPGPVTLVLKCTTSDLDKSLRPESGNVAVRIPDSDFIRSVCINGKCPLALTSANISGEPSPLNVTEFQCIWPHLNSIFDSGQISLSESQRKGSTIIDLSVVGYFKILRYGINCEQTIDLLHRFKIKENLDIK